MTLEEKINSLEIGSKQDYTIVSPKYIQGRTELVNGDLSLKLCKKIHQNTSCFAENIINYLFIMSDEFDKEVETHIKLKLVLCESLDEFRFNRIKDRLPLLQFIIKNRDKFVAIYEYKDVIGYTAEGEKIYSPVNYQYFNLAQLLEQFEKNNVSWDIDTTLYGNYYGDYDFAYTTFVVRSSFKKEKEYEEGYQYKRFGQK